MTILAAGAGARAVYSGDLARQRELEKQRGREAAGNYIARTLRQAEDQARFEAWQV